MIVASYPGYLLSTTALLQKSTSSLLPGQRCVNSSTSKLLPPTSSQNSLNHPQNHARTTSKPAANGSKQPPNKTAALANDLSAAFNRIKPASGIYQQQLHRGEAPDLFMYGEVGAVALPLGPAQARDMVNAASNGEFNLMDADASACRLPAEPACAFNEGSFDINNTGPWDGYVRELAGLAAEGLGLGLGGGEEVRPALDGLWLWTKGCVWSTRLSGMLPTRTLSMGRHMCTDQATLDCRVRKGGDRRTWATKMLILLPSAHEGGEITRDQDRHRIESWATARYRESMICWNRDITDLDFKPPSRGQRLGLLYYLHVPWPTAYSTLRGDYLRAVQALQDTIERYTVLVRRGAIAETVVLLPLRTEVPKGRGGIASVGRDMLVPSDLARVECFSEKGMGEIRGFQTHLALALLTARQVTRISHALGVRQSIVCDTEYILDDMADPDGDELAEPVRHLRGGRFSKESVLDVGAFASGVTRLVVSTYNPLLRPDRCSV